MDVAKAKRNGLYTKDVMNELVLRNNVEIVIIYSSWFEGVIPLEWQESGTWQITNNVVAGDSKVSFYAPTVSSTKEVAENLSDFSELLPPNVKQSGIYLNP